MTDRIVRCEYTVQKNTNIVAHTRGIVDTVKMNVQAAMNNIT